MSVVTVDGSTHGCWSGDAGSPGQHSPPRSLVPAGGSALVSPCHSPGTQLAVPWGQDPASPGVGRGAPACTPVPLTGTACGLPG